MAPMATNCSQTRRSMLCAPDCCFIDLDLTSCTRSFFSWGEAEEEQQQEQAGSNKKNLKAKNERSRRTLSSRKQDRKQKSRRRKDYPPPEISLSQSTVSNSSSDVSSNFDNSTEARSSGRSRPKTNPKSKGTSLRERVSFRNRLTRKNDPANLDYHHIRISPPPALSRHITRDYAAMHEMLINSLFEDAQARQALKCPKHDAAPATTVTPQPSPPPSPEKHSVYARVSNFRTKPRPATRKSSTASTASSRTSRSRNSARTQTSHHSELLTPSSHRFQRTLGGTKRRKVYALPVLRRCLRRAKKSGPSRPSPSRSNGSGTTRSSGSRGLSGSHSGSRISAPEELSSCASSSHYTDSAASFLHANCRLQKDKGKGTAPGSAIVARGRGEAVKKLGEKIDLLVEMEQDGSWSNAALTRVPARIMSRDPRESGAVIESRSMIGVKIGFVSVRYGILIHWNVSSGQAELILLRKMCSDNFLKDCANSPGGGKEKSAKRWTRVGAAGLVRKLSNNNRQRGRGAGGDLGCTPSFVTVNSNESSYGTEDNSLGPPHLEPIDSRGMNNSLNSYE